MGILFWQLRFVSYVASSLTRGWVYNLQLLLNLTIAVLLGSESHGTHIIVSILRFHNLEGKVAVLIYLRNRAAQLYPPPPGPELVLHSIYAWLLSVQHHYIILPDKCCGNNGRLVTLWITPQMKSKLLCDRRSLGQSVLVSHHHLGHAINFSFSPRILSSECGCLLWSALSDERTVL
jgi:hypothetical protein